MILLNLDGKIHGLQWDGGNVQSRWETLDNAMIMGWPMTVWCWDCRCGSSGSAGDVELRLGGVDSEAYFAKFFFQKNIAGEEVR